MHLILLTIVVSTVMLTAYIAPAISILTALVTKLNAPAWVKAVVNLFLAGALAQVTAATHAGGLTLNGTFWTAFGVAYVLSIAAYFGLLKPTGIDAKVAGIAPTRGIG